MSGLLVCLFLVAAARGATKAGSLTLPGNTTEDEATRELDLMTNSPNNRQERCKFCLQLVWQKQEENICSFYQKSPNHNFSFQDVIRLNTFDL
jgi:hypothetical protein